MKTGKTNAQLFLKRTEQILIDNQFRKTNSSDDWVIYPWVRDTKFGKVYFNPDNDPKSEVHSIFGRFENPVLAKEILRDFNGNTFSGKCNIHTLAEHGVSTPCIQLENIIKKLI
jgi:hypothetical protein